MHLGVDYDPMAYLRSPLTYCYGMYDLSAATEKLRTGVYHPLKVRPSAFIAATVGKKISCIQRSPISGV